MVKWKKITQTYSDAGAQEFKEGQPKGTIRIIKRKPKHGRHYYDILRKV